MKIFGILLISASAVFAQQFQLNDPYPSIPVTNEINIEVEKYYPVFGVSEKPFINEKIIRLTDLNGVYTVYLHFRDEYTPPKFDNKNKTLRLYYPDSYYNLIIQRLSSDASFIVYREYKDGHKWGEIYFDKYP
ncbi:MAG: hypothetical protein AB1521_17835 [Bacteroidota bacterium]